MDNIVTAATKTMTTKATGRGQRTGLRHQGALFSGVAGPAGSERLGSTLTDASGRTLYLFARASPGFSSLAK